MWLLCDEHEAELVGCIKAERERRMSLEAGKLETNLDQSPKTLTWRIDPQKDPNKSKKQWLNREFANTCVCKRTTAQSLRLADGEPVCVFSTYCSQSASGRVTFNLWSFSRRRHATVIIIPSLICWGYLLLYLCTNSLVTLLSVLDVCRGLKQNRKPNRKSDYSVCMCGTRLIWANRV